jgi:predicted nuclease of predicted toxin-antitoxin system
MKVLLDSCVWGGAKTLLIAAGHDVVWVGDRAEDPGDEAILSEAHRDERVLVTLDKDFGDLAVLWGAPHCGIVRLVNIPARQQGTFVEHVLSHHGPELLSGAIATVESSRIRIRPPNDLSN